MSTRSQLERECIAYFKGNRVFDRVLSAFREKYASYGYFAGTVTLRNVTGEELEALEGFFQRTFHGKKSISISASRFEKMLKNSRFGEIAPKEVLELYFQEEMAGKKEREEARRVEKKRQWQQACNVVLNRYEKTPARAWIEELAREEGMCYPYVLKRSKEFGKALEDVCGIYDLLDFGARILNAFPYQHGDTEYLAVFAAMLTGNPHAFDEGARDGQFLWLLIQWELARQEIKIEKSTVFPALERNRQYLAVGILRDDVSNDVMLSGVRAYGRGGKVHEGMDGFCREGHMVRVSLSVIAGWERVECPRDEIYIVENPSVYAILCKKWKGERAFLCMNGQPRLSAVLVLDLLAASGIKVYYGGDFDPEGLLIAWKVRQYYEESVKRYSRVSYKGGFSYWHMSAGAYGNSKSKEQISAKRLKMLERIDDEELLPTVEAVRRAGVAGYQENVWELYLAQ